MKDLWRSLRLTARAFYRLVFRGEELPDRELRRLLKLGIGGIAGAVGSSLAALLGAAAVVPIRSPQEERWVEFADLGALAAEPRRFQVEYPVRQAWTEEQRKELLYAYRSAEGEVVVLSPRCPHLGCLVRWDARDQIFQCPCHGGRFDATGRVLAGPPVRDLDRLAVRSAGEKLLIRIA